MESTAVLLVILSSMVLPNAVRGAFTAPSISMSMATSGAATSTLANRSFKTTAALVPPAQLRMRGPYSTPNSLNHVASSLSSMNRSHEHEYEPLFHPDFSNDNDGDDGKRGKSKSRRYPRQIEMVTLSSPSSMPQPQRSVLSRITNYYPWRQRQQSSRVAATSLHAHTKEKSSFAEDSTLDFDNAGNLDVEIDSPLHQMEKGSNNTEDNSEAVTDGSAVDSSPSIELWGSPVQSIILLNIVAVIWGTQHAVIKTVVDDSTIDLGAGFIKWMESIGLSMGALQTSASIGASADVASDSTAAYFTLARFGLAALLVTPFTPGLDKVMQKLGLKESTAASNDVNDMNVEEHTHSQLQSNQSAEEVTAEVTHPITNTVDDNESIRLAWRYGAELGLYMFLGYAFQAIGLETTTASRSGFLLYLNVKFVPFFSYFLFGKRIKQSTWISALVAFGGTALLAFDNANASGSTQNGLASAFNVGDLWSLAAAAASALFILRMEAASKAVPKASELNAANLWTVAVLSLLWTLGISWKDIEVTAESSTAFVQAMQQTFQQTLSTITTHPLPLIYLSGVTTALANFLQSKAQKDVSAERASVIYAMDPVYGAIFANILLGETLGGLGFAGAFLIVVAAATNAFVDFGGESDEQAVVVGSDRDKEKM